MVDEVEQRLRDLDGLAQSSGQLPSPGELRRRGDRKRRAQRTRLAVGTFAVVALIAGGVTAWVSQESTRTRIVPAAPATSSPVNPTPTGTDASSSTPTPSSGSTVKIPTRTDRLSPAKGNTQYWIWAANTGPGSRMLTYGPKTEKLDLTKSNRKETWISYSGQMLLIPVPGTKDVWEMGDPTSEPDLICVTNGEVDFRQEICDDDDEKQHFRMTLSDDGTTYAISSVVSESTMTAYLAANGRSLTWSNTENDSTAWIFEEKSGS
ncbi:hypothetical protein GCM10022223_58350 [Kineosporia mesophila]|uniref:Ricin B lectin domain-containing protein n=1 Tax=Kineosporia mesophila TaxID=566012 RepID=A0ABP7AH33_9ACTN|nr:hypothetical protein [Kineosporia mesophila]MCD5350803.1 hypothetical protein [Kineosporia mesophila]